MDECGIPMQTYLSVLSSDEVCLRQMHSERFLSKFHLPPVVCLTTMRESFCHCLATATAEHTGVGLCIYVWLFWLCVYACAVQICRQECTSCSCCVCLIRANSVLHCPPSLQLMDWQLLTQPNTALPLSLWPGCQ